MPKKNSSFRQLRKEDRVRIELLVKQKWKQARIAKELGFHRSTISRELRNLKNWDNRNRYDADVSDERYRESKSFCGAFCKIYFNKGLLEFVTEQLIKKRWSPKVSIKYAKNNNMFEKYFSHRSVYNWIRDGLIEIKNEHLRYGLRKRRYLSQLRKNKKKMGKSIEERPGIVNTREQFGHWEFDCIVDEYHNAILVGQERMTRYFVMERLERLNSHTAFSAVNRWLKKFPIKSITCDNGSEFAKYHQLNTDVYFTHPFSPHEKGSVENLNGRIRWDIPKRTSLNRYSAEQLISITENINTTPREILNYKTPAELFDFNCKNDIISQSHKNLICCN